MVDTVIETKDGLKLRKLVELKTSTAEEYQDAMLERIQYFKEQNQQKSIFNSTIQNTVVQALSTVLDLKIQLEKSLGEENLKKVHEFLDDFLLFGL
jgi:membrane peptidoglycan carboxypeptidase